MVLHISKQKALKAISCLQSKIPVLITKDEGTQDYKSWKDEADDIIKLIFGDNSSYYTTFHSTLNPPFGGATSSGDHDRVDYKAIYQRRLNSLDSKLSSLRNVIELCEDSSQDKVYTVQTIVDVLGHFHRFARQLKIRHQTRSTIDIKDEYDV